MATTFPYSTTLSGLKDLLDYLRKRFPNKLTSDELKKLGIASNNEGSVLSVIRFLELIDENGDKTNAAASIFAKSGDSFGTEFASLLAQKYEKLFDLHGEEATWTLQKKQLIEFFRVTDRTSEQVGMKQAATFEVLAEYCGKRHISKPAPMAARANPGIAANNRQPRRKQQTSSKPQNNAAADPNPLTPIPTTPGVITLNVRIEINLPVADSQDVYDRIFRSLRENLLNERGT